MGGLECAGCTMLAFGLPLALFILVIARDPLRIILLVLGAFFWLGSLLLSALWWFAVVPLREKLEFGLFFSIAFQEVFRFLFFLLLRKAQKGLDKISASGMEIAGVHSLKHARHTVAMVSGLGFGVMSGLFALVNVLADSRGPGIVGFPDAMDDISRNVSVRGDGNQSFFFTSSLMTAALIFLHVMWTVVFWNGCHNKMEKVACEWHSSIYCSVSVVVVSHFAVSALSFLNEQKLYGVSLPVAYFILLAMTVYAYVSVGGTWTNFRNFVFCGKGRKPPHRSGEPDIMENAQDSSARSLLHSPTT